MKRFNEQAILAGMLMPSAVVTTVVRLTARASSTKDKKSNQAHGF
jgi:hypothetical protein